MTDTEKPLTRIDDVTCTRCLYRWRAAHETCTPIADLECPNCGQQGKTIKTERITRSTTIQ